MLFFHGPIRLCIGVSKGLKRGIQDKLQQFTEEPAIEILKYTAVQHNEGLRFGSPKFYIDWRENI